MIDTDIFQIATLVLLLLALVVSLVTLSGLGKIRKQMESEPTGSGAAAGPATTSAAGAEPDAESAPTAGQARPAAAAHPLEEASYGGAAAQPAAAQPAAAQPAAAQPAAAQPAAAQPAAAQPAAAASEPQDEPFERDGRWWFRRGDELLVYEESTGQWQPTDAGGEATPGGTAPMPAAGDVATATEAGAHWKCPTCGAVNGSTADSCRMCFTPRP